jgi:hypothetical protein
MTERQSMAQLQAMAASWARSFAAAAIAVYLAGETNPSTIAKAGLAAVLPVVLRYLNPKDAAFGVVKADK